MLSGLLRVHLNIFSVMLLLSYDSCGRVQLKFVANCPNKIIYIIIIWEKFFGFVITIIIYAIWWGSGGSKPQGLFTEMSLERSGNVFIGSLGRG